MLEHTGNQTQPPNSPEWENKEGIQGWKFRVAPSELPDSEAVAWELPSAGQQSPRSKLTVTDRLWHYGKLLAHSIPVPTTRRVIRLEEKSSRMRDTTPPPHTHTHSCDHWTSCKKLSTINQFQKRDGYI